MDEVKLDFIIRIRHLGWCAYQMGAGQVFNPVINQDQYESLRDGVMFRVNNPKVSAEENHNNWMKKKTEQGWVYGPVKDFEKKTHPDLVPFNDLPLVERNKDEMDIFLHNTAVEIWDKFKGGEMRDNEVYRLIGDVNKRVDEEVKKIENRLEDFRVAHVALLRVLLNNKLMKDGEIKLEAEKMFTEKAISRFAVIFFQANREKENFTENLQKYFDEWFETEKIQEHMEKTLGKSDTIKKELFDHIDIVWKQQLENQKKDELAAVK